MFDKFQNRWAKLRVQLLAVVLHLGAHAFNNLRHMLVNGTVPQSCASQYGPQNANVSIAMDWDALNAGFNAQDVTYGSAEGKIVDSIPAIQQRAVNIEEKSIGAVPAESGTHERSSSAGFWSQIWHVKLDSIREWPGLANQLLLVQYRRLFASYRTPSAISQLTDIQLQLRDRPAECVTVHAQFAGSFALVSPVLLQDVHDEALLKFTHGF
jgi:hypothetical protein